MSRLILSLLSGVLLSLAFPSISMAQVAWMALIPLLGALTLAKTRFEALSSGFITGIIFFGVSLSWFREVTVFGWIVVALVETFFLCLFCLFCYHAKHLKNPYLKIFGIAAAWTSMEFIRSEMPVFGFGWNLLAYSQADFLTLLQSANALGVYGLGFCMAWVNAAGFELVSLARFKGVEKRWFHFSVILSLAGLLFLALLTHGRYHLAKRPAQPRTISLSLLQGNIPQSIKWELVAKEKIIEIYSKLTELVSYQEPDLIIWPEAAFPGYFSRDVQAEEIHKLIKRIGIPVLIGSPHYEDEKTAFNSAYLVDENGRL